MNTISAEREQEYGVPYGEDAIHADMDYINSESFANKFKSITEDKEVNEALLHCARSSITHRTGTLYEDMYIINGNTGEIMAEQLDMPTERGISHSRAVNDAIAEAHKMNIPIIAFHSHPEGFPPSIDDFNSAFRYSYSLGVIAGHNGQVYTYKNNCVIIGNYDYVQTDIGAAYLRGYDVDRAYKEAYKAIGLDYQIVKE